MARTIFTLHLFNEVGNLLYYWSTIRLLSFLLLLNFLSFLTLRANISVMTVKLTVKAHHAFALCIIVFVFHKELTQLFVSYGLFLAVS